MQSNISRRAALSALSASPLLVSTIPAAASPADAVLLTLGHNFDAAAARLDHAVTTGIEVDDRVLEELAQLDADIIATQAVTMEGLGVKARAACWALLGDLDPAGQSTTDKRMALSIVRDLIRLYDPSLERPGALRKLVEDIESGAGKSVTHGSTGRAV